MEIKRLRGKIKVITGLHIGGGDDTMKIGGIDNQVVKDVNTDLPYIPGSSLKGKMRSLLEWKYGLVGISGGEPFSPKFLEDAVFNDENMVKKALIVMKLFGTTLTEKDKKVLEKKGLSERDLGITRVSVSDCHLTKEMIEAKKKGRKLTEAKYENVIDRCTGTAKHPRQTERVTAGTEFEYDIRVKILPGDDEKELLNALKEALELVELDYLGGNGSRGYGRVEFIEEGE
ncbi:type III-A CRISPR-associated RAMP protein Csm3 [Caminibacter pacificus]